MNRASPMNESKVPVSRAKRSLVRRLVWGFAVAVLALGTGLTACQGSPSSSGESHFGKTKAFLRICDDGGCGSGDSCVCAVCTVPCSGIEDCRRRIVGDSDAELPDTIECRAPMCGETTDDAPGAGSVCDVRCVEDADCGFLDEEGADPHFCSAGYCRTLELPEGPLEVSADPGDACPAGLGLVPGSALSNGVALCVDVTEVTTEAYGPCVTSGACTEPESGNYLTSGRENHPIHFVTAADAEAFCASRGARLPSFEEWEAVASGGEARVYPWGDEEPTVNDLPARVCALSATSTCEVGTHPAGDGAFGQSDLAGNVAEIVTTEDGYCAAGGGFEADAAGLAASSCEPLSLPSALVGFRCVKDL